MASNSTLPTKSPDSTPEHTDCKIKNHCEVLKLDSFIIWEGYQSTDIFLRQIRNGREGHFTHYAEPGRGGSVCGHKYEIGCEKKCKLMIAWSNKAKELNKVYTQIFLEDEVVDWVIDNWQHIQQLSDEKCQISVVIGIDPTSSKPTATVTITKQAADEQDSKA